MPKKERSIQELKIECEKLGLPVTGRTKKEFIERLASYANEKNPKLKDLFGVQIPSEEIRLQKNEYFLQIDVSNLLMYLVHGVFYPLDLELNIVYKEENRKKDVLSWYPKGLVLSKSILNFFDDTQILIQLSLTSNEIDELSNHSNHFFLNSPLPVSRMIKVFFNSEKVLTSYLATIDTFPDTYLSPSICKIIPPDLSKTNLDKISVQDSTQTNRKEYWEEVLKRYDKILGMISFLKNAPIFYTNRSGEYLEYPTSYLEILGLLNKALPANPKVNSFFRWIIFPGDIDIENKVQRYQFKRIIDSIYNDEIFSISWAKSMIDDCGNHEFVDVSKQDLGEVQSLLVSYEQHKIDYKQVLDNPIIKKSIPLTILLLLIRFSNKNITHTDKQAVKNFFSGPTNTIDKTIAEYAFAVLGLYYGYQSMPKNETIELTDPYFRQIAEPVNLKFRMDSFFDRFTVESIFQFSKQSERINDSFSFLQSSFKPAQREVFIKNQAHSKDYINRSYTIFDKIIKHYVRIRPSVTTPQLPDLFSIYGPRIKHDSYLFHYLLTCNPESIQLDTEIILKFLKSNPKAIEELREVLLLDKKFKLLKN